MGSLRSLGPDNEPVADVIRNDILARAKGKIVSAGGLVGLHARCPFQRTGETEIWMTETHGAPAHTKRQIAGSTGLTMFLAEQARPLPSHYFLLRLGVSTARLIRPLCLLQLLGKTGSDCNRPAWKKPLKLLVHPPGVEPGTC